MSFNFGDLTPPGMKAQSSYKDGSGMGGGGMYFQQRGKRKEEPEDDLFEHSEDKNENEIAMFEEPEVPQDNIVNKFVNWFRIKHEKQ